MAWTAPADYNTGEVVTAAKLNTHIRDNLNYLKGNAGMVTIGDIIAPVGIAALRNDGGYQFTCARTTATARTYGFAVIGSGGSAGSFAIDDVTAPATRLLIDLNGNVGIGTTLPQGRLHVTAPTGIAGGTIYIAAVVNNSLSTLVAAGIITKSMSVMISDYNNGTNAVVWTNVSLVLGGTTTYPNTDTITVAVTAGGALTFQRTAGTQNHNISVWGMYV